MLEVLMFILALTSVIFVICSVLILFTLVSLIVTLLFKQKQEKLARQKFEDFIRNNHELFTNFKCANDEEIN